MIHEPITAASAKSPRAARRDATTTRILDAAETILGAEGLDALTMQRLAAEVGFTVGATYRYYASKEALVAALQQRVLEALSADLEAYLGHHDASGARPGMLRALVRVSLVAHVYASLGVRRPLHARLLSRMMGDPEHLLDQAHGTANTEVALRLGTVLVRELAAAREVGALDAGSDVERGLVLWASLQGIAQTKKLERWSVPGLSAGALSEQLVRTLLVGWGASPTRAREAMTRAAQLAAEVES